MKRGLAGLGKSGEWQVDIDVAPLQTYALSITGAGFYLQLQGITLEAAAALLHFLKSGLPGETHSITSRFRGSVEFVRSDLGLTLRMLQQNDTATTLLEVSCDVRECEPFAKALSDSLSEASA